jgi:CheY-like chemotaxis protein
MVKQILAFSKKDRQERRVVRLGEIINEAVKLLRATIPTTVDIRCVINLEDDGIFANSTQIHQVLLNLCTNAAHSMRDAGGVLRIEADKIFLDPEEAGEFHNLLSGDYLKVSVSDTGPGIDPAITDKIFEPYFTTKGIGEGTGMGLAVAHGIVLDHKGDIAVESQPGKGATFTILLPRHERPVDNKAVELEYPSEVKKGNEEILLVDDEELVIDVLRRMLESLGYSVTAKTSSVDALEEFCNNPEKFDLIITDMTMPNMTGKELAVKLTAVNPNIPAILCTGFSEQVDEECAKAMGIKAFIMKPVEINQLADTIREVLDKGKKPGRN